MTFGMEKLEWCGYTRWHGDPMVKKIEDMFISTEYTNVTDTT